MEKVHPQPFADTADPTIGAVENALLWVIAPEVAYITIVQSQLFLASLGRTALLCGLLEAAVHALHLADGEPVEGVIGLFVVARMAGEQGTIAARRTYAASASVVLAPEHAFTLLVVSYGPRRWLLCHLYMDLMLRF